MFAKQSRWQLIFKCMLVISILCPITFLYIVTTSNDYKNVAISDGINFAKRADDIHTILFWNSFFDDKRWTNADDSLYIQCPVGECILTNQRDMLPGVDMFDAVVFHSARNFERFNAIPAIRNWQQLYVFVSLESPFNTEHNLQAEHDFYNLTMSYRLDSDVLWTYAQVLDTETNAVIAPNINPTWRSVNASWLAEDQALLNVIKGKRKLIAWFVSNCKTDSKRENLVREMEKYVEIDVYGACGKYSCTRNSSECDEMLDNDYKFYLSFENSLCTDYVTEKLYNALNRNVIPIVYGGANYTKFAPPHSYINAQAFTSVEELTQYLQYLNANPKEYAKFFWWRKYYKVKLTSEIFPNCALCKAVSLQSRRYRTQSYRDIAAYWRKDVCTKRARLEF